MHFVIHKWLSALFIIWLITKRHLSYKFAAEWSRDARRTRGFNWVHTLGHLCHFCYIIIITIINPRYWCVRVLSRYFKQWVNRIIPAVFDVIPVIFVSMEFRSRSTLKTAHSVSPTIIGKHLITSQYSVLGWTAVWCREQNTSWCQPQFFALMVRLSSVNQSIKSFIVPSGA